MDIKLKKGSMRLVLIVVLKILKNILKMNFTSNYFDSVNNSIENLDLKKIDKFITMLDRIRANNGRLFIIGVGGSAGNASHAVNDFRKICEIESILLTNLPRK